MATGRSLVQACGLGIASCLILLFLAVPATAQVREFVRIGTYNIKFLSTAVADQGDRLQKLHRVLEALDADVLGLQEIDDRSALRLLFPPSPARHPDR